MRARLIPLVVLALVALAVPVVLAATPNRIAPTQRLDAKVLLLSADGTEPGFAAWKYELTREGVPFDAVVSYTGAAKTSTLTDARLADYGGQHAKYDAVILASGDLGHQVANPGGTTSYLSALSDDEWAALAKLERTFGVRQLSDYTAPSPAHGLVTSGGASQDGKTGTLTAAGKAAFPSRSRTTTRTSPPATPSATPGRPSTRPTGRRSSTRRAAARTSASTRTPTTGARRW
jgi:hypothetical protein